MDSGASTIVAPECRAGCILILFLNFVRQRERLFPIRVERLLLADQQFSLAESSEG